MEMRQKIIWGMVLLVFACLVAGCSMGPGNGTKNETVIQSVDQINGYMNPDDIPELERIIESSANDSIRERAVMALGDVSIRANLTDDVVPFLKKVALEEEDSVVRSAAYANLDLIRELYPEEKVGSLDLRIEGTIGAGQNITLIATVSSSVKTDRAMVGIKKIIGGDGKRTIDITLAGAQRMPIQFPLSAGSPKEIPIYLHINKEGKYSIFYVFQVDMDQVDSQVTEKEVYIYFENGTGKYQVFG